MILNSARWRFAALLLVSSLIAGASAQNARDVLRGALGQPRQPGVLIQEHRLSADQTVQLKVVFDGPHLKTVVTRSLTRQGETTLDDGRELLVHQPDRNRLIVFRSPRRGAPAPATRLSLIENNYRLSLESATRVADQPVHVVLASARHAGIPSRRFFICQSSGAQLRLEEIQSGRRTVLVDTTYARIGRRPRADEFVIDRRGLEVRTQPAAEAFRTPEEARREVGFMPILPSDLPHGFRILGREIAGTDSNPFVRLELSDGILRFNAIQWHPSQRERDPGMQAERVGSGGVHIALTGNVPAGIRDGLLNRFGTRVPSRGTRSESETETADP